MWIIEDVKAGKSVNHDLNLEKKAASTDPLLRQGIVALGGNSPVGGNACQKLLAFVNILDS